MSAQPADDTLLAEVRNLSIGFPTPGGYRTAVEGLSFEIRPGECLAIVGESGSGKTVSARTLVGLNPGEARISAEVLRVGGEDSLKFSRHDWDRVRGRKIGLILQDALVSLDPLRTIGQEVAEVIKHHRLVPKEQIAEKVLETLRSVGIPDPERRRDQYAHELSGGLRQRALVAAAIAGEPRLIIADEPTTALDVTVQKQVVDLLAARVRDGAGLLLISHDLAVVADIADRIIVMRNGRVEEAGEAREVLESPAADYTRALLAAIPSASSKGRRLTTVPAAAASALSASAAGGGLSSSPPSGAPRGSGAQTGEVLMKASNIGKDYRIRTPRGRETFTALHGASFEVRSGEILGVVGESGSGKSTCANIILGLVEPDRGSVEFLGAPWTQVRERDRRRLRPELQYIPQDPLSSFDPRWTTAKVLNESIGTLNLSAPDSAELAVESLQKVGLGPEFLARYPRSLSGGQRQRVAIARALAVSPRLIVCDEPVSALDVYVQAQVLDLIQELQEQTGTALIFISHDLGVIHHISHRVLVFKDGQLVEHGDVDDVFYTPQHPYTQTLLKALPSIVAH